MLIVIDTSLEAEVAEVCRAAPLGQLRAMTKLLQAHADSHHIVVAPPSICRIWEGCERLSEEHRGVAKKIRARYSELAGLRSVLPVHAQVVSGAGTPTQADRIWRIPLDWIAGNGVSSVHLVCEDMYDCKLTTEAARDYLSVNSLKRLTLTLENIPGGGGNTHRLLTEKAITCQRMTLCIVDSDRDEPSGTGQLGATAINCLSVAGDGLYEMYITSGRELENHIPTRIVDNIRPTWQGKPPSEKRREFAAISPSIPLFADLKSGLKKKQFQNLEGAAKIFWHPLLTQLEIGTTKCCTNQCNANIPGDCRLELIAPLGRTLLKDAQKFLEDCAHDPQRHRGYLPSENDADWLSIGALVAAYGVSVKVAAAM